MSFPCGSLCLRQDNSACQRFVSPHRAAWVREVGLWRDAGEGVGGRRDDHRPRALGRLSCDSVSHDWMTRFLGVGGGRVVRSCRPDVHRTHAAVGRVLKQVTGCGEVGPSPEGWPDYVARSELPDLCRRAAASATEAAGTECQLPFDVAGWVKRTSWSTGGWGAQAARSRVAARKRPIRGAMIHSFHW